MKLLNVPSLFWGAEFLDFPDRHGFFVRMPPLHELL